MINLCTVLRLADGDQSLAPEALGAASHDHQVAVVVVVQSLGRVWLLATPWTITRQAPLSMGFPRQEYWRWAAVAYSRGSSQPSDQTHFSYVSCTGRRVLYPQCHLERSSAVML